MLTIISLHEAQFFARHGYYQEEQVLGNFFVVTIHASVDQNGIHLNDDLKKTLNYEILFQVAKKHMQQTQKLLESVAQAIADELMENFTAIIQLEVEIKKRNPPLGGRVAASGVRIVIDR